MIFRARAWAQHSALFWFSLSLLTPQFLATRAWDSTRPRLDISPRWVGGPPTVPIFRLERDAKVGECYSRDLRLKIRPVV